MVKKAFTILEFIVSIAIVGILVSISLSGFQGFVSDNTVKTNAFDFVETLRLTQARSVGSEGASTGDEAGFYVIKIPVSNDKVSEYEIYFNDEGCFGYSGCKSEVSGAINGSSVEKYRFNRKSDLTVKFCKNMCEDEDNKSEYYLLFPSPGSQIYSYYKENNMIEGGIDYLNITLISDNKLEVPIKIYRSGAIIIGN